MRVLVAEDHASLARSIADGLREEDYAVDLTHDGEEALRNMNGTAYDCAILDIMLPGKTGWQILETARRQGSKTPVLFLTARDAIEDRVRGLDLGADDYMLKPFAFEELLARVRALIRRHHGHAAAPIVVGDLQIDTSAKSVSRAGKPISLSAREYVLLEYLALRAGQVVSRTEIWEHLYDQNDDNMSNVVDVYIGYLRTKIDRDHDAKLIHTRRGMGYVLQWHGLPARAL
ncbi:MAG TPA: response regulator transcription factor [Tepidisphaeraceae bacterium]|jgi:two-component system OmpR family response regulator|nr:response regulator transcription factor [Tepidisphaeraceae bacterium]